MASSPEHPGPGALRARAAMAWGGVPRFIRNVLVSAPTFLVDIGLLFLLVRVAHLNYLVAVVVAFLAANGLSYVLARRLVFGETRRGVRAGLIYFFAIAALSAVALIPLMWLFVSLFHLDIIVSRVAAASLVGAGGYLLNLLFNFRVAHAQSAAGRG